MTMLLLHDESQKNFINVSQLDSNIFPTLFWSHRCLNDIRTLKQFKERAWKTWSLFPWEGIYLLLWEVLTNKSCDARGSFCSMQDHVQIFKSIVIFSSCIWLSFRKKLNVEMFSWNNLASLPWTSSLKWRRNQGHWGNYTSSQVCKGEGETCGWPWFPQGSSSHFLQKGN